MLAGFSFCYNAITRGAKPEKIHSWKPQYWLVICIIAALAGICTAGYKAIRHMKEKEKPGRIGSKIVDRHLAPVVILAICLFILATILIKPFEDGILNPYIELCSGEEITDILADPIVSFYYTVNIITGTDVSVFLTVIMPIILLMLSVGCYDFIADRLSIPKEKRRSFIIPIYVILIVTYMSRDYHLFGIYTNLWEPMTVFISIFLPLQFGIMMYAMEIANDRKKASIALRIFWVLISGALGYLFRYMDPLIVFAPAVAGAACGCLENIKGARKQHADT